MKIQQVKQNEHINSTPNFKNGGTAFLRYLATNQAVGANSVDVAFMVVPRTANDTIRRGPVAGLETGRRESTGTLNHSLIGVYGIGAGALAAAVMGTNRKFGINSNKIMAAPETLNILAENKAKQIKENKTQLEYIKGVLSRVKAYNPTAANADKDGFVKLSEDGINKVSKFLDKTITDMPNYKNTFFKKRDITKAIETAVNMVTEDTFVQGRYVLESLENLPKSETNLKALINDICVTSDTFNKEKALDAFKAQIKDGADIKNNKLIKSLTKYKNVKSIAGFLIAAGIGASIQPLNMYMTKKKTGTDGFVGVEGRSKDDSVGFKVLKAATAGVFGAMVLKTLDLGFKNIKQFMGKMAFTGFWPSINQLKGIYGITIISRLLVARDKDELRESFTKDTLGFLSWLVLGDIVNRMTAEALDKSVLERSPEQAQKGFLKRAFVSKLKNRDEIIIEALSKNGISSTKEENGKTVAKKFKELVKDLDKLPEDIKKTTKKRLRTLNKAQLAGYVFSGLVLGLGIPNLNIYITNTLDKKRKAKAELAAVEA